MFRKACNNKFGEIYQIHQKATAFAGNEYDKFDKCGNRSIFAQFISKQWGNILQQDKIIPFASRKYDKFDKSDKCGKFTKINL